MLLTTVGVFLLSILLTGSGPLLVEIKKAYSPCGIHNHRPLQGPAQGGIRLCRSLAHRSS